MKPRRLIITRGSQEAVKTLFETCTRISPETLIYLPKLNEFIDATTESHIYQVKLKDSLVSTLDMRRGRDAELAWIEADLTMDDPVEDISRKFAKINTLCLSLKWIFLKVLYYPCINS